MICHIIWMSPMLKFDLVRSSSVENFEDILTIFVIFTSSGELCETIISFYIVLYHHIIYYVIWQDFMLKFDLLNIHSVLAFWRHFDQFCQRNCNLTWWKGTSGHSKLYAPWFADLHTDNILHCNIAIDWIPGLIAKGCSFVTDKEHYRSIKEETILIITVNSL